MRSNLVLRKIVAFVLLSVMLSVTMNRFYLKIEFFEDLQNTVSKKIYLSAEDNEAHHMLKDLKRPVFPFCDNVSPVGCQLLLSYLPQMSRLFFQGPYKALPEVYPEIPVPPDELC